MFRCLLHETMSGNPRTGFVSINTILAQRSQPVNPIDLTFPAGVEAEVLFNSLYPDKQQSHLIQDVLLVALARDIFIDVGWYPERDPNGAYRISVYRESWDNQLLLEPIRTADPHEVAAWVRTLAARYSDQPAREVSLSNPPLWGGAKITSAAGGTLARKLEYA
jgi:hypothetical protein